MGSNRDQITRRILQEHRHLMTEAERRADRAFAFQERADSATAPSKSVELSRAVQEALGDTAAEELYY